MSEAQNLIGAEMTNSILRLPSVKARIGLGRSSIYDRLNPKSPRYDPTFPKPISLGRGARAIGFIESEIEEWIKQQIQQSREPAERSKQSREARAA